MPITAIVSLLGTLAQSIPFISKASAIGSIIKTVTEVAPVLIQTYRDITPSVNGVINALKDNPATTEEQLAQLDAISAKVDADFDAAVRNQD